MYIMYYIDKIKTVMEDFIFQCKNCFYKKTEEEETIPDKCYKYLYYFFCCIYIYDN